MNIFGIDMVELDPPIMGSTGMTAIFFIVFVAVLVWVGWQVVTIDNGAIEQFTKYCDDQYGKDNWTLQNGYACPYGIFHDCIECRAKVDA